MIIEERSNIQIIIRIIISVICESLICIVHIHSTPWNNNNNCRCWKFASYYVITVNIIRHIKICQCKCHVFLLCCAAARHLAVRNTVQQLHVLRKQFITKTYPALLHIGNVNNAQTDQNGLKRTVRATNTCDWLRPPLHLLTLYAFRVEQLD